MEHYRVDNLFLFILIIYSRINHLCGLLATSGTESYNLL